VGFDLLTTCQPSTVWCSRERLPAAAAQPAQGSSEPVAQRIYLFIYLFIYVICYNPHFIRIQTFPLVLRLVSNATCMYIRTHKIQFATTCMQGRIINGAQWAECPRPINNFSPKKSQINEMGKERKLPNQT
jgi:hypothetical protein